MKHLIFLILFSVSAHAQVPEIYQTDKEKTGKIFLFNQAGLPDQYRLIYSQWVDVSPGDVLLVMAQAQFENTLGRDIPGFRNKVCQRKARGRVCVKQGTPVRNVLASSQLRISPSSCEVRETSIQLDGANGWNMTWNSHYAVHTKIAPFQIPPGWTDACVTLWAMSGSTQAKTGQVTRVGPTHGHLSVMKWSLLN